MIACGSPQRQKTQRSGHTKQGVFDHHPIYIGKIESSDYGVSTQGDFEPVVDEATSYRAQVVLDGRVVVCGPRQRNHPDFPLRGFVRCELDVQGILAFAEHVLPRAADLQASLNQKQRLQQLFLPEGIAFDGNRFNRTAATAPLFNYLAPNQSADERMVSLTFASWNPFALCLRQLDNLRVAV